MFGRRYFGERYFPERYYGPGGAGFPNPVISAPAVLLGSFPVTRAETDPDARAKVLGFRPSTPLLVYAIDVQEVADIAAANVPEDGHFLMSAVFLEPPGNTFTESGASAGAIGQRIVDPIAGDIFSFRRPSRKEVVWFVKIDSPPEEQFLLRFEETEVWLEYRSLPQRILDAVEAFNILDPDRVYDFYAKIVAAITTQFSLDNHRLLDFIDPELVPDDFLSALAAQFGLDIRAEDSEAVNRRKIKNAVPTFKLKGLAQAIILRLRDIGFSGFANEIWTNPTNPDNFDDIASAPSAVQMDAITRGIFNLVQTDSGQKGTDIFEAPHEYFTVDLDPYFLTSRLSVHVNQADGEALDLAALSAQDIADIKENTARELRVDILPAHVDIRQYVTDFEVGPLSPEPLEFSDVLVASDV